MLHIIISIILSIIGSVCYAKKKQSYFLAHLKAKYKQASTY